MKKDKGELNRRLKAYAAAAAGALAVAPQAEAAIHYSGPRNIVVDSGNPIQLVDLNNDAVNDFALIFSTYASAVNYHSIYGLTAGNSIIDVIGPIYSSSVANLPANYPIGNALAANRTWYSFGILDYHGSIDGPFGGGYFLGQTGYIGVRFNAQCGTAYGWIQYAANSTATTGTIIDWAYEDNCQLIAAGQTQSIAIPTLNEWGLLALTALLSGAAIKALRKKEQENG